MSNASAGFWNTYNTYDPPILSTFQPYISLVSSKDENGKQRTNSKGKDITVSDSGIFSRLTFDKKKGDTTELEYGDLNVYGSIESVRIDKSELKSGRTEVTIVIKTFVIDAFQTTFFKELLTLGSKWTLHYGWYVGTVGPSFTDSMDLVVYNFNVQFGNDGTYDITVNCSEEWAQVLYATNTIVSGKLLQEEIDRLKKTRFKPLSVRILVDALNSITIEKGITTSIIQEELVPGNVVKFRTFGDTLWKNREFEAKYFEDVILDYTKISELIRGEHPLSKILNDAIIGYRYYEPIFGLKNPTTVTEFYLKPYVDATNKQAIIFNRLGNYRLDNKYYMTWGSEHSLIENLAFETEYSITDLIEQQRALVRNEGNASANNTKTQRTVTKDNGFKNSVANVIKIMTPAGTGPATISIVDSQPGTQVNANEKTNDTTKESKLKFITIINTYFSLANLTIWGTPGIDLFERITINTSLPTDLIGKDYHIIGISHDINKNTYRTSLKCRMIEFG